jgi:integrase
MDELKKYVEAKRPSLSKSSITTYSSILNSLYNKVFEGKIDPKRFEDTTKVLKFLHDVPPNRRKTILSALVVITDEKPYRELMLEDVRNYNKDIHKQEKTETQKENWVDGGEIKAVWDGLKKDADLLYKKANLKPSDLQHIQNFIIISLLGGIFIPPRRSKDFCDFKIKDISKDTDNYIEKSKMYFNSYKTAKTYGQQVIDVPKPLQSVLKKWISVNPTPYLLFDSNMNKLTSVKLNQRINKIFDEKHISVNALRHSFLTDKYEAHSKTEKELSKDMKAMGSSTNMADTYIKLD